MLDTIRLTLFFFTALVILEIPGPAVLGLLRAQRHFSGGVFIALGLAMAFSGQNRK